MKPEAILNFIDNKEKLQKKEYNEIIKILDKFPYFQTGHLLHLCSAQNISEANFQTSVEKSSLFVSDREVLFNLLENIKIKEKKTLRKNNIVLNKSKKKALIKEVEQNKPKPVAKTKVDGGDGSDKKKSQIFQKTKTTTSNIANKDSVAKVDDNIKKASNKVSEIENPVVKNKIERKERKLSDENGNLNSSGQKIHTILMNEVFTPKIDSGKKEKEIIKDDVAQKEKTAEKVTNIEEKKSTKSLTDDIFAKILSLEKKKPTKIGNKIKNVEKIEVIKEEANENKTADVEKTLESKPKEKEIVPKEPVLSAADKIKARISKANENKTADVEKISESKPKEKEIVPKESVLSAADKIKARISKANENKTADVEKTSELKPKEKEIVTKEPVLSAADKIKARISKANENKTADVEKTSESKPKEKEIVTKEPVLSAADKIKERIAKMKAQQDLKNNNLIEKFIKEEPRLDRTKEIDVKGNVAKESVEEKKEIITELMAKIYINQGYYDKAINVFEKLILKNPEKKDYFAEKIDEAKKMKNQ